MNKTFANVAYISFSNHTINIYWYDSVIDIRIQEIRNLLVIQFSSFRNTQTALLINQIQMFVLTKMVNRFLGFLSLTSIVIDRRRRRRYSLPFECEYHVENEKK